MREILVVGAGEVGLRLAAGAQHGGAQVTVLTPAAPETFDTQRARSTQVIFAPGRAQERQWGLDIYPGAPQIEGLLCRQVIGGEMTTHWQTPLPGGPAVSINQPDRFRDWAELLGERGVSFQVGPLTVEHLTEISDRYDLVCITQIPSGSDLDSVFPPAQVAPAARRLAAVYFDGVHGVPGNYAAMTMVPGIGEVLMIPALFGRRRSARPVHIALVEAVPGGEMDTFTALKDGDPQAIAGQMLRTLEKFVPQEYERCANATLVDPRGTLVGEVTPLMRAPVGHLPASGRPVMVGGDAACRVDPLSASGANTGARWAGLVAQGIADQEAAFDADWMVEVDGVWRNEFAGPAKMLTEMMLTPPPPIQGAFAAAAENSELASILGGVFEDPANLKNLPI